MATLDELESRLQALLEVQLLKHLPGYKIEDGIAQQLAAAMRARLKEETGVMQAPNLYVIVAHPSTLARWHAKTGLVRELADAVFITGKKAGFEFHIKPTVNITTETNMPEDELRVVASFSYESLAETQGILPGAPSDSGGGMVASNAFLIVGGSQIIPLNRSVINIGRRLDNHVVIDDPRVSRAHAQLRIVKDRYVIFDLNSSGGTFVNGQRVNQSNLSPGDVISLAGVSLIFGQDSPSGRDVNTGPTRPGVPAAAGQAGSMPRKANESIQ
jgi:FHA domain/FhaA, N-terminal domain